MWFLANLTLARKVVLLTGLGVIVGVGVFSYLSIRAVNQATEIMLEDRLTTAGLVADRLDETMERAVREFRTTASTLDAGSGNSELEARMKELEATYTRLSIDTYGFYLVGEQGQLLWSDGRSSGSGDLPVAPFPFLAEAASSRQATISGLTRAPFSDKPVVLVSSPSAGGGQNRAVLVAAIDLAQSGIGGFVQPIRLGRTGYVEVIDQNGMVLARTDPGPKLAPFEESEHSGRFAALIAAGKPTRGQCHTCHEPIQKVERRDVLAFVPMTQARWGVVIRQSEEEALAPINQLRQNLLLSGVGIMMIAILFVLVTTRDVVGRVRVLTSASRRIAGGDLVTPVTEPWKDEIGALAGALDDMRERLRTSYGALEQRTKELSSLISVSVILTSLSDLSNLDTALGSALDKTLEIMRAGIGGILLLDDERQALAYRVHRGLTDDFVKGMSVRPGEGIAGRVVQTGRAILVEDILADPRAAHSDLVTAEGLRSFASVPLRAKDKTFGALNIASLQPRKFSPDDMRLLESIAGQIATAIENARLHQEVQRKEEVRGELLRDIFSIQEEERRRIARELHDETSQDLAGLTANLEAAAGVLPTGAEKAEAMLRKSQSISIRILDEIHKLIYELRPTLLDDLGLVSATRWLIDTNLKPAGMDVVFKTAGQQRRLPPRLETTLFRIIQEAVTNITRHSEAENVEIGIYFRKNNIRVSIKDEGKGFDVRSVISSKDKPRGLGLLGMKERVELVNGVFNMQSTPGKGTDISMEVPVDWEVEDGQDKSPASG